MNLAISKGAIINNTITKKTDYIMVGEKARSKINKAINWGITVLTEDEFLKLLEI